MSTAADHLEPQALGANHATDTVIQLSIAISLKRIADALVHPEVGLLKALWDIEGHLP